LIEKKVQSVVDTIVKVTGGGVAWEQWSL